MSATNGPRAATRRTVLRHGAKLAYVAPAVVVAMRAESAFAASDGKKDKDKDKDKGGKKPK